MGLKDDLSNKKRDKEKFFNQQKKMETICCKLKINFLKMEFSYFAGHPYVESDFFL